ncbi:MAG: nucleotidyltransferase family protein [Vicinamibacteria bacterium]
MTGERLRVAAIVLAAGSSRRMGTNKLLLSLEGEPLVRRSVRRCLSADFDRVVVVLGHESARVRAALDGLSCEIVENADHARGVGTSIRTGVGLVADAVDAIAMVLADMPYVTTDMLRTVVSWYRATRPPVVVSEYGGVQAPPTLYDRALFARLLAIPDDSGGKAVAQQLAALRVTVAFPESARRDLDATADYERARAKPTTTA